jgi:hypothetical protein
MSGELLIQVNRALALPELVLQCTIFYLQRRPISWKIQSVKRAHSNRRDYSNDPTNSDY